MLLCQYHLNLTSYRFSSSQFHSHLDRIEISLQSNGHGSGGEGGGYPYDNEGDWLLVSEEEMYVPGVEDVGKCLKIECTIVCNDGTNYSFLSSLYHFTFRCIIFPHVNL